AGRQPRCDRLFLVLSEQESRRVRRRRARHHRRRGDRPQAAAAPQPRDGAEVLPPPGRRQLPHGRAAGGDSAGEGAASCGLDRGAPAECRTLCSAVQSVGPRRTRDAAGRAAGTPAHLQPVRHSDRRPRWPEAPSRRARYRQRDLLSGAVPPAAVLRRPRLPRRRVSARRARRPRDAGDSDLRRADRLAAGGGGRRDRGVRPGDGVSVPHAAAPAAAARRRGVPSLTTQIFIGLILGVIVGYALPQFGVAVRPLADAFLRLIKMIIAPLLFSTLVVGIAGAGDLKAMGRIGLKAIVYFEVATTIALVIGLALVNVFKPGAGMTIAGA